MNSNSTTLLYGFFRNDMSISDHLRPGITGEKAAGNLFCRGYMEAESHGRRFTIFARIYNEDELTLFAGTPAATLPAVIMEVYNREGVRGFRRINGKFTIIIREPGKTVIVRDRNGEGPMIYYTTAFFTDSYQGLQDFRDFKPEPDLTGLTTFLKIGYIPAPVTSLAGVSKVPSGEVLTVSGGEFRLENLFPFEDIHIHNTNKITFTEATAQYHELLKQSIRRRIGNSSTVGALLSGGYDSGGNIAVIREVFPGLIKSYSIGFKDNPASELPFARMMAEKFSSDHHEYLMDGTEIDYLPDIIDYMGDPFSESGFMLNHSAMKMVAGEDLPVIIGGDGNDQYFGAGIRETALHYSLRKSGLAPLSRLFDALSDNALFDHDNLAFRLHFQNQKILRVMEPEIFGLHDYHLREIFDMSSVRPHPYISGIPHSFNSYDELFHQRNYFLHLRHSVQEVILFKASRLSARFGVNLAFSYVDRDIINFLQSLPVGLRAKGSVKECMKGQGVSKYIHKALVKPMLPSEVTNRPKQGGFSPLEIFFNDKVRRENIYRYIAGSAFAQSLKNKDFLPSFFARYEKLTMGKSYWFWYKQVKSNQMINLLILAIWWDKVLGNKKKGSLSEYLG